MTNETKAAPGEYTLAELDPVPIIPGIAALLEYLMGRGDAYRDQALAVIRRDPAITLNLLRHYNAPERNPSKRVMDSLRVITLLYGTENVAQQALQLAKDHQAAPVNSRMELDLKVVCLHAYAGAELGRLLASQFKLVDDVEMCYTATLLRSMGRLAQLAYPPLVIAEEEQPANSGELAPQPPPPVPLQKIPSPALGEKMVAAWKLPPVYEQVILGYLKPNDAPGGDHRTLIDVIHIADARSRVAIHEDGRYALMQTIRPTALGRTKIPISALEHTVDACLPQVEQYWDSLSWVAGDEPEP